jgi:predicted transcriptional regulator YdeE
MSGCGDGGCGPCGCCGDEPEEYQVWAGIDNIPTFEVIGISSVIKAEEDINALWDAFFKGKVGAKIEGCEDDVVYAVYSDYEGDHTQPFRLTIGYRTSENVDKPAPEGMHSVYVVEDEYGLVSTRGKQPEALMDGWKSIWQSDLERNYKTDFEVYGPNFFEEGMHEAMIAVGVTISPLEEGEAEAEE